MFGYETSPPPLRHSPLSSDRSHDSSRGTTPGTPVVLGSPPGQYTNQPRDPPRFHTNLQREKGSSANRSIGRALLEPDFDDTTFPLFGGTSPFSRGMAGDAGAPIPSRHDSASPRGNQASNLTFALRRSANGDSDTMKGLSVPAARPPSVQAETSHNSNTEAGTRPISVKGKTNDRNNRRESVAQSMGMGISWGGISVGSWIRDDMMMSGTSPFAFHASPSYHSSSYLPKLEANFMRDFSCCGLTLPSLHDLLQHYEEAHAQKEPAPGDAVSQPPLPDSRAAIATNTANQVQQEAQQRSEEMQAQTAGGTHSFIATTQPQQPSAFPNTLQTIPGMDTVEDMDMDDIDGADEATPPSNNQFGHLSSRASPSPFSTLKQQQVPQLNTTMMQGHQAYRNSTPNTPIASTRNSAIFQGANTSSTLMANPMQQYQDLQNPYRSTPDSSAPGTPGELDEALMTGMDDMTMQNNALVNNNQPGFGSFGFGMNNDMIDLCIDEPAKRLFQPNQNSAAYNHNRLGSNQYGPNSEIARRIREQQMLAGLPDTTTNIAPHEEPKPFRCPVIGCEKAYKNQNGLKYHKSHGHNNQRLHENGDGTFSIVNPDTQAPYPGTMGMEKEKPYKCEVCQKRYKNLNGLKYHKTHSPPCNPDLVQQQRQGSAGPSNPISQSNVNMGGLGVSGLSNDGKMM